MHTLIYICITFTHFGAGLVWGPNLEPCDPLFVKPGRRCIFLLGCEDIVMTHQHLEFCKVCWQSAGTHPFPSATGDKWFFSHSKCRALRWHLHIFALLCGLLQSLSFPYALIVCSYCSAGLCKVFWMKSLESKWSRLHLEILVPGSMTSMTFNVCLRGSFPKAPISCVVCLLEAFMLQFQPRLETNCLLLLHSLLNGLCSSGFATSNRLQKVCLAPGCQVYMFNCLANSRCSGCASHLIHMAYFATCRW